LNPSLYGKMISKRSLKEMLKIRSNQAVGNKPLQLGLLKTVYENSILWSL